VTPAPPELYLASTSPRRRLLLERAGVRYELCEPGPEYEAEQTEHDSEAGDPIGLARERARRKAVGASPGRGDAAVLGVDTVVDLDGTEIGKARDRGHAEQLLLRLAGREHRVHTAHCLFDAAASRAELAVATAVVACRMPARAELQQYLDSEQWRGKAGAYGIQDEAQRFFSVVDGSIDTVIGLHVEAVLELLARMRARS
jgi:septum formation protein